MISMTITIIITLRISKHPEYLMTVNDVEACMPLCKSSASGGLIALSRFESAGLWWLVPNRRRQPLGWQVPGPSTPRCLVTGIHTRVVRHILTHQELVCDVQ